ncbi:transposase [Collinsella sp. AM28-11LB]|nr:transposase [Collinsella sp. AM28-11LB]
MYTKEEREGILWEFHRSGLSAPAACRQLPLFPNKDNLYAWLKMEEAGELTAREMPDRAERMHCSHGEGSPAFAARRSGAELASPRKHRAGGGAGRMKGTGRGGAGGEPPMQTDWRDWGLEGLPDDPAERAREAEVRLAEALAALDVLKAPGPGSLTNEEKRRAGEAARRLSPAVRLADVIRTLSIPKSTYLEQAPRISRPDPKAALRERVRASFEASGGAYGPESVTADLRRGPGEPVSWRELAPGDAETPVVASEKVVRRIMREDRPGRPQGGADAQEGEVPQLPGRARGAPGQRPAARGRDAVSANLKPTTFANVSRRMRQRAFANPANVLSPTAQTELCSDRVSDPGGAGYGAKRNGRAQRLQGVRRQAELQRDREEARHGPAHGRQVLEGG